MSKSSTTTRKRRRAEWIHNPHPGEILLEEFLKPLEMSQNALARALKVPPRRVNELVLQADFDQMEQKRKLGPRLEEIEPRGIVR